MTSTTQNNTNNIVTVDVVSDNICPLCFVGKRSLETAVEAVQAQNPGVTIDVRWHPFQLNENLPLQGTSKREAYIKKMGAERAKKMEPYMIEIGKKAGISFSYGGLIGNTFQSHRLTDWARKVGGTAAQDRVVEGLFRGYFEQEGDLTDQSFLLEVVRGAHLEEAAAKAMLESEEGVGELYDEEMEWRQRHRISSVPFFLVDGATAMSGAQQPEAFQEAIEAALVQKKGSGAAKGLDGLQCGPEGCAIEA